MKVAIIGAGNMGGAVARGIAAKANDISLTVSNPSAGKLDTLAREYPDICTTSSNTACARGADMVIIAVKPWKISEVIDELRPELQAPGMIIVSVVAGISPSELAALIGNDTYIIYQAIPNTAATYGSSMTFITSIGNTGSTDRKVKEVFDSIGITSFVEQRQLNAGMAVASCGIAFMMRFMRAMTEGGVELGLRPHEALAAVAQTMRGAADIIQKGETGPETEIDKVTTAGGITIRGLNTMEENGLTGAILRGLRACKP